MANAILVYSVLIALLLGILVAISGCGDVPTVIHPNEEPLPNIPRIDKWGFVESIHINVFSDFTLVVIADERNNGIKYHCKFRHQFNYFIRRHDRVRFKGSVIAIEGDDIVLDDCRIVKIDKYYRNRFQ